MTERSTEVKEESEEEDEFISLGRITGNPLYSLGSIICEFHQVLHNLETTLPQPN